MATNDTDLAAVTQLIGQIGRLLHGHPPEVQGAVLADLLSLWIAGHIAPGNHQRTERMRNAILRQHIEVVRQLIPESSKQIHGG